MALVHCSKCGELYAESYKTCPFCAEDAAYYHGKVKKNKVVHHTDRRQKAPSIFGPVLALIVLVASVTLIWTFFGEGFKNAIVISKENRAQRQEERGKGTDEAEVITLEQKTLELTEGESELLMVSGAQSYTWTSSDESIATVSSSGTVTAVSGGEEGAAVAVITVTGPNGNMDTCSVTVKSSDYTSETAPVEEVIDLSKIEILTHYGTSLPKLEDGKFQVGMATNEAIAFEVSGTDKAVTWSSSDTSVVTVAEDGTCRKVGYGTAIITAKVGNTDITIEVVNAP